ncbi:hypothetical protein C9J49_007020 [Halomonas sp. SL1]|nr:hypothetical protein C9J49_007020 [Halomonas sp. SL1]
MARTRDPRRGPGYSRRAFLYGCTACTAGGIVGEPPAALRAPSP